MCCEFAHKVSDKFHTITKQFHKCNYLNKMYENLQETQYCKQSTKYETTELQKLVINFMKCKSTSNLLLQSCISHSLHPYTMMRCCNNKINEDKKGLNMSHKFSAIFCSTVMFRFVAMTTIFVTIIPSYDDIMSIQIRQISVFLKMPFLKDNFKQRKKCIYTTKQHNLQNRVVN